MIILSIDGESVAFTTNLLWPESSQKYSFLLEDFTSWLTIENVTIEDADQVCKALLYDR